MLFRALAVLFLTPLSVFALSLDNPKTKEIFTKAKAGDHQAEYELGLLYLDDRGPQLKKSEKDGFHWLMKAANAGHVRAQAKLGELYEVGRGTDQDTNQAVRWYKKAADAGDAQAKRALEFLPFDDSSLESSPLEEAEKTYKAGDYKTAFPLFEKLAKEGNPQAQYMYGRMLLNAQGTVRDYSSAMEWTKKAADQGVAKAMYSMGLYFKNGWGVEKDPNAAAEWFSKAAVLGDEDAAAALKGVSVPSRNTNNGVTLPTLSTPAGTASTEEKKPEQQMFKTKDGRFIPRHRKFQTQPQAQPQN